MYFQPKFTNGTYAVPDYSIDPFVAGLSLKITGLTTFTLSPGSAKAFSSNNVIQFNPMLTPGFGPTLNLDISTTGPLGCFPVPLSQFNFSGVNVAFGVYIIGDTGGIAKTTAIIATGDNFLPTGYNVWRKIGTVYVNNSTLQLYPLAQEGYSNERKYTANEHFPGTTYGPTSFFIIPLGVAGPCSAQFATDAIYQRIFIPNAVTDYAALSTLNSGTVADLSYLIQSPAAGAGAQMADEVEIPIGVDVNGNAAIYVSVVGAGAQLIARQIGWKESMGLQAI